MFSLDRYFEALTSIKNVADATREQMTQLEVSACSTKALRRWDLQVRAHTNNLNFCLREATRILNGEYYDLNYFDKDGARVANHVQNQGLNMMGHHDILEEGPNLYNIINHRLRDLLLRAGRKLWLVAFLSHFLIKNFL